MMTLIYFIVALGILVLVHEWGHFIVARKAGIRVEQFSIGFGPKIFGFTSGGTEFKICPIPLGGYVKLYGEDPVGEAEGDDARAKEIAASPDAFSARPIWARLATVMAGPSMNLILCIILMPIVFMLGRSVPVILESPPQVLGIKADSPAQTAGILKGDLIVSIDDKPMATWTEVMNWIILHPNDEAVFDVKRGSEEKKVTLKTIPSPFSEHNMGYTGFEPHFFWGNDPVVGTISPDSPAALAGFMPGDRVTALNGQEVTAWDEMTTIIRANADKEVNVTVKRDSGEVNLTVIPKHSPEADAAVIGVMRKLDENQFVKKKYAPLDAVREGMFEVGKLFGMTTEVLGRLFSFQLSYKALGGPLQIAQATGAAAKSGLSDFLYFLSFLSLQLGVLNLLPIPVLDGGHVLFMSIEAIRRKPLSMKLKNGLVMGGMFFLLGLMVLITINDVDRVVGFETIKNFFLSFGK